MTTQIAAVFTFLVTTLSSLPTAYADVNMMEASFQADFIDLQIGGLKISRRYNSRTNFNGVFGFGWCSTFDAHLQFSTTPQGQALAGVNECGRIANLGTGAKAVKFTDGSYVQKLTTGLVRTFSAETGELISLRTETGPEVRILRTRTRLPRDAALGEGLKMRLEFDDLNEMVTALETSEGKRLEFTYSSSRDLLSARNAWSNTYRFNYDALHNLTRIEYPDSTREQMSYDADHDQLLSFEGRKPGCKETYSHRYNALATKLTQVSTSRLICAGILKRQVQFDFTYTKRGERWSLTNLKVARDHDRASQTPLTQRGAQ